MKSLPYAIHASEKNGIFELQVRELCLSVRGGDLSEVYDALRKRAAELASWATDIGGIDLPTPRLTIK